MIPLVTDNRRFVFVHRLPEYRNGFAVKKLQGYITQHYYNCNDQILLGLGQMYAAGGEFTENIDAVGGIGTAEFANRAIAVFCR